MSHHAAVFLFLGCLFVGMVLLLELGRRTKRLRADSSAGSGLGPLEGALFGLLGLLLAFTFSSAAARFDARRHLIVEEANAISTAYLRLDLLPPASQQALRASFREYTDARLHGFEAFPDLVGAQAQFDKADALQGTIWRQAVAACKAEDGQAARLLIPALNEMFDITTTRAVAMRTHLPNLILGMLAVLAFVCAFLAGTAMPQGTVPSVVRGVAFPLILVVTVYVILDLEYPRAGLIRIDSVDEVIADVRRSMDAP
jgi:hypothetical protein